MAKPKNGTPPDIDLIPSVKVDINLVDNNTGQIPGVNPNPREMTEMEYRKLKKSLSRHSVFTAINEMKLFPYEGRWVAIGGNMRLEAMRELGWTHVIGKPIPADTDADTLNYYILLDNASFGKWDFDRLANEWNENILDDCCIEIPPMPEIEAEEEAKDDNFDVAANTPKEATSRLGDIYQLGEHRLIVGDSTKPEFLDALCCNEDIDCIVTDPPYNVNYQGGTKEALKIQNDNMSDAVFEDFLHSAFVNADAHLKRGGAFYIWHADTCRRAFIAAAHRAGWIEREVLIWNKNSLVLGRQDYQWKHEPCLYGWKEGAAHYFINRRDLTTVFEERPDIEKMSKEELKEMLAKFLGGDIPTTVIDENKPLRSADHPTMKPVPLIGRLIRNSTRPGEIVLDMFGGSGTTMIACEQLGRKCRMVEYDPIYADVIIKRWEEFTGNQAVCLGNILDEENSTKIKE